MISEMINRMRRAFEPTDYAKIGAFHLELKKNGCELY